MSSLNLKNIYKVYPSGVTAVTDFNLDIEDKEFIVFVGPSGCGKSTTLRMIAGLEEISSGELYIDGVLVNNVAPKDRDIAMVFQNYALYPHMTVYENMAFGLKLRKMPKAQIDQRVKEAARILGIEQYLSRKPKALSGGQRQRVALGRAIVREPKVFLLDEPLSNLDAKLRTAMRAEIVKIHQRLGTTFIYVTHDQVEAMTMGTRIVVMKLGVIQQIDTPTNLFDYPVNKFVAGFIGTPQMNFFDVTIRRVGDKLETVFPGGSEMQFDLKKMRTIDPSYLDGEAHEVTLGIRAENMRVVSKGGIPATLSLKEVLGNTTQLFFRLTDDGEDSILCVSERNDLRPGEGLRVAFSEAHIHLFDRKTECALMERTIGNPVDGDAQ